MVGKISELTALSRSALAPGCEVEVLVGGANKRLDLGYVYEKLAADRTYYVRTDGSDSNTGLANTSGGAWLTLQKAVAVITQTIDLNGFSITVNVADGTYTGGLKLQPFIGAPGEVFFTGNTGTPANCIISTTSKSAVIGQHGGSCRYTLAGFEYRTTTSGYGVAAYDYGQLFINEARFGACAEAHLYAGPQGRIEHHANYTISGDSPYHWYADQGGFIYGKNLTVTASGTRNFSQRFAYADSGGKIYTFGNTYSGTFTGRRFECAVGAVINTFSGGQTYFPGDNYGIIRPGGAYDYQPITLASFTVAQAGSLGFGSVDAGMMAYITNETGGAVPAFFDGTNWRRVTDRNVIS